MADTIINSYFTQPSGLPATGLSPTIRIWEVNSISQDLIIGTGGGVGDPGLPGGGPAAGPGPNNDGIMLEVVDGAEKDGFYKYTFDTANGFNETLTYLARVDGGPSLPTSLRFQVVRIDPSSFVDLESIPEAVWGADPLLYPANNGTMGGVLNNVDLNVTLIRSADLPAILELLELVRKYDTNRTRIDPATNTLTIYDDDCITPLRVFKMLDHRGDPTVTNVCEKSPQDGLGTTDGYPTCAP